MSVLFDVRLELSEPDIIFEPSLDTAIVNNFYDQILNIVDDVFHMTRLVPRVALPKEGESGEGTSESKKSLSDKSTDGVQYRYMKWNVHFVMT